MFVSHNLPHADIVECNEDPCDHNGECEDTEGSFICTCNDGYDGNGFNCTSMKYYTMWLFALN